MWIVVDSRDGDKAMERITPADIRDAFDGNIDRPRARVIARELNQVANRAKVYTWELDLGARSLGGRTVIYLDGWNESGVKVLRYRISL